MTSPGHEATLRPRRSSWKVLVRVALAGVLLAVVFLKVDFRRFGKAFAGLKPWHIVGAYLFYVVSLVFKAFRWHRLAGAPSRATPLDCFSATANGLLFGLLAPGMYEFARTYAFKLRARRPFAMVLGTVVAERSLDAVLLLTMTFFVLVLVPGARWLSAAAAMLAALVAVGLGLLVLLVCTRRKSVPRLEEVLARMSPRLARWAARFLNEFADGLRHLGELKLEGVLTVLGLSVLLWSSRALYVLLVFRSLGLHAAFGLALFIAAVENLGMLVKLTPAGLGQYQLIIVAVLVAFGIGQSIAAGASIVLHAVRLVVTFSLGLPFLYREHFGMSKLEHARARQKESSP